MRTQKIMAVLTAIGALMTISASAMAQTAPQVSEPGTLGIGALGIGIAIWLARRNRK